MEALIFDNDTVRKHRLYPRCGSTLHKVSKKDYDKDNFFDERIECLDIDSYETSRCAGHSGMAEQPTADAAIGVRNHLGNGRFSNPKMMIVELRMDYETEKNLSGSNMSDKIKHTRELLGMDTIMHGTCYFVFRDNVIQAVKNKFKDLKNEYKALKKSEAVSTSEFDMLVKSRESYPYRCENDLDRIKTQLDKLLEKDDISGFINTVTYWIDRAREYEYRYNHDEYQGIISVVNSAWASFRKGKGACLHGDDKLYVEIMEVDNPELSTDDKSET